VNQIRTSIQGSLSNDALLYGRRTESMFEAMIASIGEVEILKQEDSGEIYVSNDALKVPDFRLVLADGSQVLVEVKNHHQGTDAMKPFELDKDYLDGLVGYANVMKCDLFLAVYWSRWNLWTLVPPQAFHENRNKRELDLLNAMKANHMASLGDYSIGTRFPLSIVMYADKAESRFLGPDGSGDFRISNVEVYCAGTLVAKPEERRIATYLMFYGKWHYESDAKIVKNEIESVEHRWVPQEDNNQGFEIVGSLGEMFSTYYRFFTQEEGRVERLQVNFTPGSLGQLIPKDYKRDVLPLWRFRLKPSVPSGGQE